MARVRFRDVSNRQLSEALAVIEEELEQEQEYRKDTISEEDLRLLTRIASLATLGYIRRRLPMLLGF